jgi:hypothetical protein
MRKSVLRTVLALGIASVLFVASSMAANRVEVRVMDQGSPVVGVAVDIIGSSGVISGVTGSKGEFITDIAGTHFRVRVEGKSEVGGHTTAESPVTITLD